MKVKVKSEPAEDMIEHHKAGRRESARKSQDKPVVKTNVPTTRALSHPATRKSCRVLLAEAHALVRAGVRSLLCQVSQVEVVGETSNGHELLELVNSLRPDIVIAGIMLAGLNGIEAARRVTQEYPKTKFIILSTYTNKEHVARALRAGASGYLLKEAPVGEIELALKAVSRGERYLSPQLSSRAIDAYLGRTSQRSRPIEHLSARQREIIQMIAEGKSTREIAFLLNVSLKTVESHRATAMHRLKIHDVTGLVRFAIRNGLTSAEV